LLALGRTPCPPGLVSVNSGSPARTTCAASPANRIEGVPQWVNELPVNSGWQPIAGGPEWPGLLPWQRGDRIDDVKATPIDIKGFRAGIHDVIKPWCGGAYNPDRKELLLVANGGGGGYAGNETYTLEFSRDTPGWRRLVDRTPDAYMDVDDNSWSNWSSTSSPGYLTVATHRDGPSGQPGDGRPKAMHTFGQVAYANGRIWNTGQPAATPNLNAQGLFSLDREWVAQQPGDFAPWTLGDIMGWVAFGLMGERAASEAALQRIVGAAFGDGMLPEAYDPDGTGSAVRHWFAWPGAALAAAQQPTRAAVKSGNALKRLRRRCIQLSRD